MSEEGPTREAFMDAAPGVIAMLQAVAHDRTLLAHLDDDARTALLIAAGRVVTPDRAAKKALAAERRRLKKAAARDEERQLLQQAGIRQLRENPIFLTPRRLGVAPAEPAAPLGESSSQRTCYVCRTKYTTLHSFYDRLCVSCGDFNYAKRHPSGDLRGRVALVTGARLKIGYQAAILLLRSGCHVIVTTRFPRDAAQRYAREEDFADWSDRLEIHGIDLRHVPSIEDFCARLIERHSHLDFIINNACQTVRRPPGFYDHLMEVELGPTALEEGAQSLVALERHGASASASLVPLLPGDEERSEALFPTGALDADLQQVDLREVNSWRLKMADVPTVELLEVQLVNAVAPFLLNARLKPLMMRHPTGDRHIVNVSAMEGQFYRTYKSDRHPHTNMAKASLNMMTRTSARDYVEAGIHMNSVDTGWVTDEDPAQHAAAKTEMHDFHPPLDIVDGAARIVDPIFDGLATGTHVWGQFLKDYTITDW